MITKQWRLEMNTMKKNINSFCKYYQELLISWLRNFKKKIFKSGA